MWRQADYNFVHVIISGRVVFACEYSSMYCLLKIQDTVASLEVQDEAALR